MALFFVNRKKRDSSLSNCTFTLLERLGLNDQPPTDLIPSRSKKYLLARLKANLSVLFNTSGLSSKIDPRSTPQVARSVLNYGIGSIAGRTLSSLDPQTLEKRICQAIFAFEPRIIRHHLHVTCVSCSNASTPELQFVIEGLLREASMIYPFKFYSVWSPESGEVRIDSSSVRVTHG
ncbi:type VI secretion system baseplate subunit TssE [Aeromonas jandaei]|uniref:type VI secretion system baseplate subunit TssE n=1 Tax=Aeromonas jandaei TaxID=650 RepID=UPI003D206000